jgi:hypothetical protein
VLTCRNAGRPSPSQPRGDEGETSQRHRAAILLDRYGRRFSVDQCGQASPLSGSSGKGDPVGWPRKASPAGAIALLGGALAGSGPGTSPCIDGLSLVTAMVVPSTLRVQTTHQEERCGQRLRHGWRRSIGSRMLGRFRSVRWGPDRARRGTTTVLIWLTPRFQEVAIPRCSPTTT